MAGAPRGPRLDGAPNTAPVPPLGQPPNVGLPTPPVRGQSPNLRLPPPPALGQSPNLRLPPPPPLGQSPNLRLPPPPQSPGQGAPGVPPPASVTGSRRGSAIDLPASGTTTQQLPGQDAFGVPPPASVTASRRGSGTDLPAAATPTQQPPGLAPPASAMPSREAFLVEPPPQQAAPPAPITTGPSQQPQPLQGTDTAAMVPGVPSQSAKKEYLSAVKAYEQQLGPNILRGKMYIESLPADAVPPEQRFYAKTVAPGMVPGMAPGAECGYNMAMGVGPGQPCGYGMGKTMGGGYDAGRSFGGGYAQPIASERVSSGTSLAAQRSRERLKEFAEMDTALKFAELAEMGPEVKRLMDMGGRLEDIINLPRNYEEPMVQSGSDYSAPPMRAPGSFEGPMNAPGGFGRQPMPGYGAPMRLSPDYAGPPDRYDGPLGRYDGPPDRYYGPPDQYYGRSDRYYSLPQRYDCRPNRYDGRPPNARSYGSHAFPGEDSRSVCEDELPGRAAPKQYSEKRALDLLHKIRDDIQEHCTDGMFQQIHREVAGYEIDEKEGRRVRGGRLPQRTTSPRRICDDDGESRTARRFRDDYDVPRKSPPPRRQPSRRRQESSSSTSSSSDGKLRRSRTSRRRKSLKSRSKRRSKSVTKRSPSSSSSSLSGGHRRGKGKSAKKENSSSSSSSSSDARREKKKGEGVEFKRSVTGRISSQAQKDLESIRKHCEAVVKSLSSTRGGNGCPLLNILGIRSREQASLNRPPSRNIVDVLPMYGIEDRSRSRNFGGEMMAHNGVSRPASSKFGGEAVAYHSVSFSTSKKLGREVDGYDGGVQSQPARSIGEQAQRMRSHGSVYRYESKPSAFKQD
ncbi:hypothetical protein HPB48_021774 [Haemaphysalis longicornis]|uniref:Uncharacterized protein n=1 Tax=Haemaphysalis longicornis TaxID=44386 RepID=A0A9J6FVM4_HAELO|nr:hypothetical protein HPB48_021774 [Haemaphysalis longicornis]